MNTAHLQRKMQTAQATRRIWIDEDAHPFPMCCCLCGEAIDLDYSQGYDLMTLRLNAFLNSHEACPVPVERVPA